MYWKRNCSRRVSSPLAQPPFSWNAMAHSSFGSVLITVYTGPALPLPTFLFSNAERSNRQILYSVTWVTALGLLTSHPGWRHPAAARQYHLNEWLGWSTALCVMAIQSFAAKGGMMLDSYLFLATGLKKHCGASHHISSFFPLWMIWLHMVLVLLCDIINRLKGALALWLVEANIYTDLHYCIL